MSLQSVYHKCIVYNNPCLIYWQELFNQNSRQVSQQSKQVLNKAQIQSLEEKYQTLTAQVKTLSTNKKSKLSNVIQILSYAAAIIVLTIIITRMMGSSKLSSLLNIFMWERVRERGERETRRQTEERERERETVELPESCIGYIERPWYGERERKRWYYIWSTFALIGCFLMTWQIWCQTTTRCLLCSQRTWSRKSSMMSME